MSQCKSCEGLKFSGGKENNKDICTNNMCNNKLDKYVSVSGESAGGCSADASLFTDCCDLTTCKSKETNTSLPSGDDTSHTWIYVSLAIVLLIIVISFIATSTRRGLNNEYEKFMSSKHGRHHSSYY